MNDVDITGTYTGNVASVRAIVNGESLTRGGNFDGVFILCEK